jgi:CRP/FNR family transcriptional regulator, cyclic AMP receptor protein
MRIRTPIDAQLAAMPLFAGLPTKTLRVISKLSTPLKLPTGTALTHEGTPGREFFVLLDGEVEVIQGHRLVATRGPGSHLGEIALLERRPRTATLVAKTQLHIAVADRSEFTSLLDLVPEVSERLHDSMHQRLGELVAPT